MKALLTSSGITTPAIEAALVELLGRPVAECSALIVATGIYPFDVGPEMAGKLVRGEVNARFANLDWRSVGLLELSVLPSIDKQVWLSVLEQTDALLVWGGDPLFLSYWLTESGVAEVLPSLDLVYVGASAGAMAVTTVIGETYTEPRTAKGSRQISSEQVVFDGDVHRTLVLADGIGLVDFSLIVHYLNDHHGDVTEVNAQTWASKIPAPTYVIDERTALKVVDGAVEVVSDGAWKLF